jgi:DNA-binding beta-propeller fold protein YncE
LDTNTKNLTPKGRGVAEIASVQNGKFAIAISQTFNVVYVIDTESQSLEGYIFTDNRYGAATGGLRGIAVDSNDTIYLASRDGDQILQLDGSRIVDNGIDHDRFDYLIANSWTLTGENPSDIKLSPDEQFLYVTSASDNFLEIVDIASQTAVKLIDTELTPTKMTTVGDFLFVSNFVSNSISVIDVNTQELVQTIK